MRTALTGVRLLSAVAVLALAAMNGASVHASSNHVPGNARHAAGNLHLVKPGYLSVGSDTSYPPMESADTKHPGTYIGADIDLANALARAMGLKGARIVPTSFDSIIPALQRGNFDIIMSSMNDTPVRRKQINFIDYMRLNAAEAILVSKGSSIHGQGFGALCGHTVAVESGTVELDGLHAAAKHCGHKKMTIKSYTADTDAFNAFASGHADAYTTDLPVALYYVKQHPSAVQVLGKAFGTGGYYGIGLLKKNAALNKALRTALLHIEKNGQYMKILDRYGLKQTAI